MRERNHRTEQGGQCSASGPELGRGWGVVPSSQMVGEFLAVGCRGGAAVAGAGRPEPT